MSHCVLLKTVDVQRGGSPVWWWCGSGVGGVCCCMGDGGVYCVCVCMCIQRSPSMCTHSMLFITLHTAKHHPPSTLIVTAQPPPSPTPQPHPKHIPPGKHIPPYQANTSHPGPRGNSAPLDSKQDVVVGCLQDWSSIDICWGPYTRPGTLVPRTTRETSRTADSSPARGCVWPWSW